MKRQLYLGEMALYALTVMCGVGYLMAIDAVELFYQFSRSHEEFNLDELVLLLPMILVCLVIYAVRRSRDVSRRNKEILSLNEEIREASLRIVALSESREKFLSMACHELKSPLVAVVNALHLLAMAENEDESRDYIRIALERTFVLNMLIEDVLLFSQLSHKAEKVKKASFNVRETLESVEQITGQTAKEKGLNMTVTVDDGVPEYVVGHMGWLRLICLNLVGNAIKYTDNGFVAIHCSYITDPQPSLVIRIVDSGRGIPEDKIDVIFKPYERAEEDNSLRSIKGFGLGLSVVKEFVQSLEGAISVESTVGSGSTFVVQLPVEVV
ncbi:HAMP domain-containing sensor histidine kinase [uncultured Pseudodesulfovibrio sp.]|uniref:sensor histidine kinase n=1 Tax=uncultured Pseudodesulfovibrio sp. TaxID=2035858 RepID=UPI0029C7C5A5|nr:HAMP domain-containing sensor histidine kinase [uncultured Pseudodesulfovibrio sp.]